MRMWTEELETVGSGNLAHFHGPSAATITAVYGNLRKDSAGHVASCARTTALCRRAETAEAASARDETTFTVVARSASRADCVTPAVACAGLAITATNAN